MAWGVLTGLGDALQGFGSTISKDALQRKLEEDRAKREEGLEQKRYERQRLAELNKVAEARVEPGLDGQLSRREFNAEGRLLNERPLSQQELEQYNADTQKTKLSLEKLTQDIAMGKKELEGYDANEKLKRRETEARISNLENTGLARILTAEGRGGEDDIPAHVRNNPVLAFKYQYEDELKDYISSLGTDEVDDTIREVLNRFPATYAAQGKVPPTEAELYAGVIRVLGQKRKAAEAAKKNKSGSDDVTPVKLPD